MNVHCVGTLPLHITQLGSEWLNAIHPPAFSAVVACRVRGRLMLRMSQRMLRVLVRDTDSTAMEADIHYTANTELD